MFYIIGVTAAIIVAILAAHAGDWPTCISFTLIAVLYTVFHFGDLLQKILTHMRNNV